MSLIRLKQVINFYPAAQLFQSSVYKILKNVVNIVNCFRKCAVLALYALKKLCIKMDVCSQTNVHLYLDTADNAKQWNCTHHETMSLC